MIRILIIDSMPALKGNLPLRRMSKNTVRGWREMVRCKAGEGNPGEAGGPEE